jgi:hypothetical protein
MKRVNLLIIVIAFVISQVANAASTYYWPTPYPLKNSDGSKMSQDLDKVHIWDGWLPSVYYDRKLIRDSKLQLGGLGDQYRIFVKFDLEGLPKNPDMVALFLKSYYPGNSSTGTPLGICKIGSSWNLSMTWETQPSFPGCYGWYISPTPGDWWGIGITSVYKDWKNGVLANNGIMMFPQNTNNNFDAFRSSRYLYGQRPTLGFSFTPTIELKMPLPGKHQWLVTTETGGWDCKGRYDQYHDGSNYFSLDFSWRNLPDSGATVYTSSSDIPVLAAGGGKVYQARYSSSNGYYVVVDHDGDGNINTGFSTRYLHLVDVPPVYEGQTVRQGAVIGYMGNTGISYGKHLHFGVRYQNNGSSSVDQLAKVLMEGGLLKAYQTECSVNGSGAPTDWNRFYRSYNTAY